MKLILLCTVFVFAGLSCKNAGSQSGNGALTWLTIEEAGKLGASNNDKKFLIDVYTDWCGWCKVMDKKTFSDPELIKYLNDNFHVVKFNAEQKETLSFRGQTYNWQSSGRNGVNMLALELLQGRLSYPTLVYLNENLEPIRVSPGYKDAPQLIAELKSL